MTADRFLRIIRRFDATPERVFDAWLNPATARKWLFTTPADETYTAAAEHFNPLCIVFRPARRKTIHNKERKYHAAAG